MEEVIMTENKEKKAAMVLASLYGDAFALGPHWIYDQAAIRQNFGDIRELTEPLPNGYHQSKHRGDFTHYGDQTLFLLKEIIGNDGFDLQTVKKQWADYMTDYTGYLDNASRRTLKNVADAKPDPVGSPSHDLSAAGRIAPFIYHYDDDERLLQKVEEQTRMTHNNDEVVETALYFSRVCVQVLAGVPIKDAVLQQLDQVTLNEVRELIDQGIKAADKDSIEALKAFGTTCAVAHSLPGTVQIILHHHDNLTDALSANVMAGGDSAARGLIIGAVLGAALSPDKAIFQAMSSYREIELLLQ